MKDVKKEIYRNFVKPDMRQPLNWYAKKLKLTVHSSRDLMIPIGRFDNTLVSQIMRSVIELND